MRKALLVVGMLVLSFGLIGCSTTEDPKTQPADNTGDTTTDANPQDNTQPDTTDQTEANTGDEGTSDVQVVDVEAYQFGWDPNPIRVEAGRPVRLELSSRDVAHGIGIPELGVSKQIPAGGETVTTTFTPEQTGEYNFICNVYCGQGHRAMTGTLIVE